MSDLSRRELLALIAGVPLASLVGCGRFSQPGFSGELHSPDFSMLHRIRDGWRPNPPEEPHERRQVVIVGAGMAGLSAAWELRRQGVDDFVILESGSEPGGTAISGRLGEYPCPWGAHYVPVPMRENRDLIDLFREMRVITELETNGDPVVAEQYLCREPEERVFADGIWQPGLFPTAGADEEDREQLKRFREQMETFASARDTDGRRLFGIPVASASDAERVRQLDRQSMASWMDEQGFHSTRLRWLVDYSCRDDYGLTVEQTSAWAGIFYFASRLRGDGTESQPVMTWPEGNGRIVDFLVKQTDGKIRSGAPVTRVANQSDRVEIDYVDVKTESAKRIVADAVVFAAPHFLAPHVIEGWSQTDRPLKSFRYGGWIVGNVLLKDRPKEASGAMCWDNVICDSRSLGYVTSTHQSGRDHGATVLTWYHPLLDDDPRISRATLMRLTWPDWVTVIVSDLKQAHPDIENLIERIDVMRWGHAMIQPRVGFVWGGARESACKPYGKVHFACSDLSGVALMEEAFYWGVAASRDVVNQLDA